MPNRIGLLGKALASLLSGPAINEPRKGSMPISPSARENRAGSHPNPPNYILSTLGLKVLAERDDIIVALRRVLRNSIGETAWRIVPDIAGIESDIKRWKASVELNLSMPGLHVNFAPQVMNPEFFQAATGALRNLLMEEAQAGVDFTVSRRMHNFFDNIIETHRVIAESHVAPVKALFERPNAGDSWRSFISQVVDSLTLYDCAAIVKNPKLDVDEIGELYLLPAENIRVYRRKDRGQPAAPYAAYDWSENDRILAYYNAIELAYLVANPQGNGYGKPPIEALVQMMLASISSDNYLLEFFQNNNMPAGIFDLGPNVDQGERDAVERKFNNDVRKGIRRINFVSFQDGVKGFVPIPQPTMKDNDQIALIDMWTKRKAAVFGLSPNDIGHTQDMHLANSEQQAELTQSRGIDSLATIIENELNSNIIKGQMWRRNNPDDVNDPTGYAIPLFPFQDVRFEFEKGKSDDDKNATDTDAKLWAMGVVSINEIRKKRNMSPIPGGDEHVVSGPVTVKVGDLPALPKPAQAPMPSDPMGHGNDRPAFGSHPVAPKPLANPESDKHLEAFAHKLRSLVKGKNDV